MKARQFQLKTVLSMMVFCLSLLTLAGVGVGWYNQQHGQRQLDALLATSIKANNNVKMSYIDALLALSEIDDAVKLDDETQRKAALAKAHKTLASSQYHLSAFLKAGNTAGGNGEAIRKKLKEAFTFYWNMAASLEKWALTGKQSVYASVKNGQIGLASSVISTAFYQFDQFVRTQNRHSVNTFNAFSQRAKYIYIALVALAIMLAVAAYLTLSRTIVKPLKKADTFFNHIAAGDLTQRIDTSSRNEIGALYVSLKRMQDSLARIVATVRAGMEQIMAGSQTIVDGNTDLSARTEEQAAALQQTAASMEQLASTVKQNADNARQANQLAATASDVARRGGQVVGEVVVTMQGISGSSRKIADIVGVIDSIAFQTNILALNAAVEAARAGSQGKGFAVVATEVRALAQRSALAAKEIKGLIDDSVKKVSEGSGQVERAGATMQEIVASVARVTDIMEEISAASVEQSSGIDQINHAVAQMDDVTQQNAMLVEQAAASATRLGDQIVQVTDAVAVFRIPDNLVIDVSADSIRAPVAVPSRMLSESIANPSQESKPSRSSQPAQDPSSAEKSSQKSAPSSDAAWQALSRNGVAGTSRSAGHATTKSGAGVAKTWRSNTTARGMQQPHVPNHNVPDRTRSTADQKVHPTTRGATPHMADDDEWIEF